MTDCQYLDCGCDKETRKLNPSLVNARRLAGSSASLIVERLP